MALPFGALYSYILKDYSHWRDDWLSFYVPRGDLDEFAAGNRYTTGNYPRKFKALFSSKHLLTWVPACDSHEAFEIDGGYRRQEVVLEASGRRTSPAYQKVCIARRRAAERKNISKE